MGITLCLVVEFSFDKDELVTTCCFIWPCIVTLSFLALRLFSFLFYCLQSTVRDLFSVDENEAAFEEMVVADKRQEEQPAKKNQKSQNAFEEVGEFFH